MREHAFYHCAIFLATREKGYFAAFMRTTSSLEPSQQSLGTTKEMLGGGRRGGGLGEGVSCFLSREAIRESFKGVAHRLTMCKALY